MEKIQRHLSGSTTAGEIGIAVGVTAAGTVIVIILASNPIGWVVAGVALVVGAVVYAATQVLSFLVQIMNQNGRHSSYSKNIIMHL